MTDYLQLLLRKSGYRFTTTAEKEIVRTLKEKVCVVSQDLKKDLKDHSNKPVDYALPDGNILKAFPLSCPLLLFFPFILIVNFLILLFFVFHLVPDW